MRRLKFAPALLFALALAACAHVQRSGTAPTHLRAMTYNIRLDLASDGDNAWPHRRELVAQLIRHEAPDVFGTQEVLLHQKQDLERALPGYAFVGVGRDDGRDGGEFSPLAYRTDRFVLVDSGTFWLSPTPDTPGKGWDAAYPRVASWALLRDRHGGGLLHVLNTHFDHVGQVARANSARMIVEWAATNARDGAPAVVMGDFNSPTDSEPFAILTGESSALRDSRTQSSTPPYGPSGTFNNWDISTNAPSPIDHVFVSGAVAVTGYEVDTQHWGGRLPSDHYPVIVDMEVTYP